MAPQHLRALSFDSLVACKLTAQDAFVVIQTLSNLLDRLPPHQGADLPLLWRHVSKIVLRPDHPFEVHQVLFKATYQGWDAGVKGPPPAWIPTPEGAAATNAARFIAALTNDKTSSALPSDIFSDDPVEDWPALHRLSVAEPEVFWPPVLRALRIKFHTLPSRMLALPPSTPTNGNSGDGPPNPDRVRWLPGARLNIAECALSGRDPDAPAILWAEEGTPRSVRVVTRWELAQQAQHVADALLAWGLRPGDAVGVDMPMVPEAVVAFLGIILAGCVAVSIADSFAPREIEARLRIARAKAVFTQDALRRGGKSLPLYSRVVGAGAPRAVVLSSTAGAPSEPLRVGDLSWDAFLALAPPPITLSPHVADAAAVSTVLFSSGTTADPKAIPFTHTTPIRCAADAYFHQDVRPGDAVAWPTSMGWMMGPWLVYATLLNGAAMALFGGSPLGREFGEFVAAARVAVLGLVPSIARVWRATNCMLGLDWRCLRCFSSTGEASAAEEYLWLSSLGGYCPVIEYCGGTEIGGGFLSGSMLQPQVPAAFSTPTVGAAPVLLLSSSEEVEITPVPPYHSSSAAAAAMPVVTGELALRVPQLGVSQRLLNADHGAVYYAGMPRPMLRRHGDEMALLPGGWLRAHGRVDDTMNLGGIKVASVELERAVTEGVQSVAEAAAVAVPPPEGGPDRLVLFLVLENAQEANNSIGTGSSGERQRQLVKACQAAISTRLNPLFKVGGLEVVGELPRTASNKVMRRVLRDALMAGQRSGGVAGRAPAAKL